MIRERITKTELKAIRRIYDGGMRVDVLAAEIGIAVNTLYRWLNGSRTPGYLVTANVRRFLAKTTISDSEREMKSGMPPERHVLAGKEAYKPVHNGEAPKDTGKRY